MYRFDPEQITFFAKTDARGREVPFGIKAKDRTKHVYVIGKTGMGKSTLLENMAVQDIKHGNGLAFIDPHGQTAETLLDYIPPERKDDVLYFAPFDTDYPVSFNVMEDVGPDKRHLVVSGLMAVFKKIWVDAWSARMEYILSNTLLALLEYPDSTLLGVNRMLSDKAYRQKVVDNISDPAVKSFWVDEFANYNERYMQEAGDAIKNKIGQFTSNPLIRNIVGQPKSSFDIRQIMDERKIMIMNLSKGLVGESNANLLGSMLTTRIYLAAMSRADLTQEEMKNLPNFYFYVDEFQSFANATFADILSEARKYKLNLTIAHQYIEQMEEEVKNAVFGNVGTIITFRVGPFDAEVLESIFTPKFLAPDIVNLGFAQIYLTLMIDGIGSPPFSAMTLPPIEPPEVAYKSDVIEASRRRFAHPRAGVEAMINTWHEKDKPEPTPKKNNQNNNQKNNQRGNQSGGKQTEAARQNDHQQSSKKKQPPKHDQSPSNKPGNQPNQKTNTEKSAAELREVLRSIARDSQEDEAVPATKQASTTKPKDTKNTGSAKPKKSKANAKPKGEASQESSSSLKDALAAAVSEIDTAKPSQAKPKPQTPDQAPQETSNQKPETPETPETTERTSPTTAATDTAAPPTAAVDDPLAPKKLERMMRVTTSDKPPLR